MTTGTTPPRIARAKPIQRAMPTPSLRPPLTFEREVGEDRRDQERGDGAQELDDREDPLQVGRPQGEAGDEERRRDGGAEADAGEEGGDQGHAFARRALRSGRRRIPSGEEAHADERQPLERLPGDHLAEDDRGQERAAELRQVEQAEVERRVFAGHRLRGQRRRRDRGRGREQGEDDAGDRDRGGRACCGSSAAGSSPSPGRRPGSRSRRGRRPAGRSRSGRGRRGVASIEAPKKAATQPTAASPIAGMSTGEVGSAGGASSKVRMASDEGDDGDAGDDPEERTPGVGLGLQPADRGAGGDRAEDAHAHDHGRRLQFGDRVAERQRRHRGDQQKAGAEALDDAADVEHDDALRRRR